MPLLFTFSSQLHSLGWILHLTPTTKYYTNTQEAISQEAIVRKKADNVRAKKEEIELARDTTVEDLTKGLLNYRFTGLTFKRSEQGALRYVDVLSYMHAYVRSIPYVKRDLEYIKNTRSLPLPDKIVFIPEFLHNMHVFTHTNISYFLPKLIVSSLLNLSRMIQHVNSTLH